MSESAKEKKKLNEKRWCANNKDRVKEIKAKSAAKKRAEDPRKRANTSKEYRDSNPHKIRETSLRYYGITADQFDAVYLKQNGMCAICNKEIPPLGKGRHLDHCHKTNVIRGILCTHCNFGLGNFKDNIESLSKAMEYLKTANTGFVVANPARLNRPNSKMAKKLKAQTELEEPNTSPPLEPRFTGS